MTNLGPLADGARVVVIGGGPGGVACAVALKRMSAEAGRCLDVTLVEGKQFSDERQNNICVGVVTPPMPELLQDRLGIPFPYHLSKGKVSGYILHTDGEQITLDDDHGPSMALRRVQFDDYMLASARERGVDVKAARAVDLELHDDQVLVYTENATLEADVVVGAFGMDDGMAAAFARAAGYRPPQALSSVVTNQHNGPDLMEQFGSYVHAFLLNQPGTDFGAVTPKENHLTINIAGPSVRSEDIHAFLKRPQVRAILPCSGSQPFDPDDARLYKGRFPCSLAQHYYGDRFVMVGDASGLLRAFKGKGLTSAILTSVRAAETILQVGISDQAFGTHYRAANRDITDDIVYGQAMRFMVLLSCRLGLLDPVVRAALNNPDVREALYGAVSAHMPYRQVLADMLRPGSVVSVLRAMLAPRPKHM